MLGWTFCSKFASLLPSASARLADAAASALLPFLPWICARSHSLRQVDSIAIDWSISASAGSRSPALK